MSGSTDIGQCPRCGGDHLVTMTDWKPFDMGEGHCLDCGLSYYTVVTLSFLEDVNADRKRQDLEPLQSLAKPTEDWLEGGNESLIINKSLIKVSNNENQ